MTEDIVTQDPATQPSPAPGPSPEATTTVAHSEPAAGQPPLQNTAIEPSHVVASVTETPAEAAHEPAPAADPEPVAEAEPAPEIDEEPEKPVLAAEEAPAEEAPAEVAPAAEEPVPEESHKHWYVVKVQSGREESIKEAIERRVKIEGLEEFFGQIIIPVEKVTEVSDKNGKRVVQDQGAEAVSRLPDGRGGVQRPNPLSVPRDVGRRRFRRRTGRPDRAAAADAEHEVERMLVGKPGPATAGQAAAARVKPKWLTSGDRVKVGDGTFPAWKGRSRRSSRPKSKVARWS